MNDPEPRQPPLAKIAVIGAGWWSQGWHIPQLYRHPHVDLVAIVDRNPYPRSNLNPHLESLEALGTKYQTSTFTSVRDMLQSLGNGLLHGVIIATPHATHSRVAKQILKFQQCHTSNNIEPHIIHVLIEKPFTTSVQQAKTLHQMVTRMTTAVATTNNKNQEHSTLPPPQPQPQQRSSLYFAINHTANYRLQCRTAQQMIQNQKLGEIRNIQASFSSPLSWIFEDPANVGWNTVTATSSSSSDDDDDDNEDPPEPMLGNGFAWGQSSHVLAWIFHVCQSSDLRPLTVSGCCMTMSDATGADVAHAASILCATKTRNDVVLSLSGTSLLPGNEHATIPIGKLIRIEIYGSHGAILYSGNSQNPRSGRLEFRKAPEGTVEYPLPDDVGFDFEEFEGVANDPNDEETVSTGAGLPPQSVQCFIDACRYQPHRQDKEDHPSEDKKDLYVGADTLTGLRTVQTLEAMYRSHVEKRPCHVLE
jgi:predicted dehydrogenase